MVVVSDERPYRSTIGMLGCDALSRAAWLQSIGIGRGDVVALQLPNWYEGLVIQAATFLVGATVLPIVPIYGPREVEFILRDSGATVVVLAAQVKGRLVASALIEAGAVKSVGTVVVVGDDIPSGAIGWEDTADDWREGEDPAEPDDIALLVYTSGTTSDPKGVKHTHRSLIADTLSPVVADGAGPDSSHLSVFPSGHVAAANGLLRILIHATPTVLMDVWNPVQAAELIDEYAVTSTAGAPIHLSGLLDAQERGEVALATLRGYLVGGASVRQHSSSAPTQPASRLSVPTV
ncbi:Long-chain-fatty-acid--CoA ligase [Gordonia rubripertincta]|nr:Long-chain-fatty-acid--CoA ligase [Gordonia rubripertincta]